MQEALNIAKIALNNATNPGNIVINAVSQDEINAYQSLEDQLSEAQIELANATNPGTGLKNMAYVLVKRLTIKGFLIFDHDNEKEPFETEMSKWLLDGKIKFKETIYEGIENAPKSFIYLLLSLIHI